MMPNKTIYVSDNDLPIFEQAQELAGNNLSSTIVHALRQFIERHNDNEEGFKTLEVKVGKIAYTFKRFKGRLIAKGHVPARGGKTPESYEVYQTPKDNLAVYISIAPEWSMHSLKDSRGNEVHTIGDGEFRLEVYRTLSELEGHVPDELFDAIKQNLSGQTIEDLDI